MPLGQTVGLQILYQHASVASQIKSVTVHIQLESLAKCKRDTINSSIGYWKQKWGSMPKRPNDLEQCPSKINIEWFDEHRLSLPRSSNEELSVSGCDGSPEPSEGLVGVETEQERLRLNKISARKKFAPINIFEHETIWGECYLRSMQKKNNQIGR